MDVENDIFWSEIGSGFGEQGGAPQPRIPSGTPRDSLSSNIIGSLRKQPTFREATAGFPAK